MPGADAECHPRRSDSWSKLLPLSDDPRSWTGRPDAERRHTWLRQRVGSAALIGVRGGPRFPFCGSLRPGDQISHAATMPRHAAFTRRSADLGDDQSVGSFRGGMRWGRTPFSNATLPWATLWIYPTGVELGSTSRWWLTPSVAGWLARYEELAAIQSVGRPDPDGSEVPRPRSRRGASGSGRAHGSGV